MEGESGELNTGPPASNLRKNSGRIQPAETVMSGVSDNISVMGSSKKYAKGKNKQKEERIATPTQQRSSTPSVKSWLETTSNKGYFTEDTASETKFPKHREPIEDWDDEVDNTLRPTNGHLRHFRQSEEETELEDSDYEVVVNNKRRKTRETQRQGHLEDAEETQRKLVEGVDFDNLDDTEVRQVLKQVCIELRALKIQFKQQETKAANNKDDIALTKKVVIKHDRKLQTIDSKVNKVEVSIARPYLIITGIIEKKGENCKELVKAFFAQQMKITEEIAITTAHRVGKTGQDNRDIRCCLSDVGDKATVYKHAKNLKDKTNEEGKNYFISDQLPDKQDEQLKCYRQKIRINKTIIDAQQQTIEIRRGSLKVNGTEYSKRITEPSSAEILEMDRNQIKKILAKNTYQGDDFTKNGSSFTGFAAKVHTIQEVADGYSQMRYRFMDATHIICAYRIMDPDVAHMTDSVDDGELGAGRRLVQTLIDESYENIAVYVIRHHRGPNIGAIRFNMIIDAAKSAVEKMPSRLGNLIPLRTHNARGAHTGFSLARNPDLRPKSSLRRGNNRASHTRGREDTASVNRAKGATSAARVLDFSPSNQKYSSEGKLYSISV